MGGYGSGKRYDKKTTVEECLSMDAGKLAREKTIAPGLHALGSLVWRLVETGEETSSVGYELNTLDVDAAYLRLYYRPRRTGEDMDYKVSLTVTRPPVGGVRWWFVCPLVVGGRPCLRRVRKLYLPPGGRYFGCRHCHNLTYESSQTSDKRVSALRGLDPDELLTGLEDGTVDPILLFKAMRW